MSRSFRIEKKRSNKSHLKRYFQCQFVDNPYQYVLLIKYSIVQSRTQSNHR